MAPVAPVAPVAPGAATLVHPGPAAAERIVRLATGLTRHDVALPAGEPLLSALERVLAAAGARSAVGELAGGSLAALGYHIPDVGPPGGPVATFSPLRAAPLPVRLVRGGLTVGRRDGELFAHSHAQFVDADGGTHAGHLVPDSVVLGAGVRATLWCTADVEYRTEPDPETGMTLFVPRRTGQVAAGGEPAVVCRLRPNTDLVGAVEALVEEQGWAAAAVRGQLGSLVGGTLVGPDGAQVVVDGPATEVMTLAGEVRRVDGRVVARLDAVLVDRHATVHRGTLVPGRNAVAMTFELALSRTA